jgi:signal peptidase I
MGDTEQPSRSDAKRLLSDTTTLFRRARAKLSEGDRAAVEQALASLRTAIDQKLTGEPLRDACQDVERYADTTLAFAQKSKVRELVDSVSFAFGLALILRALVIEAFQIPSGSMEQTLLVGDHLFVSKFSFGIRVPFTNNYLVQWRSPQRGDIVVFSFPVDEVRSQFGVACLTWQVNQYRSINGGLPARMEDLQVVPRPGQCNEVSPTQDAWGTPYAYRLLDGDAFEVRSAGLDRAFDTGDDMATDDSAFVHTANVQCDATEMFVAKNYIKRVIGLPGDEVEIRDGAIHINGAPFASGATREIQVPPRASYDSGLRYLTVEIMDNGNTHEIQTVDGNVEDFGPITVREGHVFVMGDNRDGSLDSRCWGQVPVENIKGEAQVIFYSRGEGRSVRWDRLFRIIH